MPELTFYDTLEKSITEGLFVKAILSKPKLKDEELLRIIIKPVEIKKNKQFSFVFRYPTRDITKNFSFDDGVQEIKAILGKKLQIANLFTTKKDHTLRFTKKGKAEFKSSKPSFTSLPSFAHDRAKKNYVKHNDYLIEMGILKPNGAIAKGGGDKYKQIQKYIEIVEKLIEQSDLNPAKNKIEIMDMGSGKGYLTFALYDFLNSKFPGNVYVTGVEIRKNLVSFCNALAAKMDFKNLNYIQGYIQELDNKKTDILIALHACDTATDEAINSGIKADAKIIVCAPCCHKQVRKSMFAKGPMKEINKYGILMERQAELATDAIRALLMEANGYQTKVFEFISNEHTGKNIMIAGTKSQKAYDKEAILQKSKALMDSLGIQSHHLDVLLEN